MKHWFGCALLLAGALVSGCSKPEPPAASSPQPGTVGPKITQLYSPEPTVSAGEPAKICYGVENTKAVWIAPPMQKLSVALARCVEVQPKETTTYSLTVEGADGARVSQEITIAVGAPKAKIVNVNVSALEVKPGQTVTICYTVQNASEVTIEPPGYHGGAKAKGCASHQPVKTTTYTIAASGPGGSHDREQVTVKVQ